MPVQIDVLLTAKDREGHEVNLRKSPTQLPVFVEALTVLGDHVLISKEELEKVTTCSDIRVICDNPKCAPVLLQWNQEKAGEDENHLPDAAYRIIKVVDFVGQEYVYCSPKCATEAIPKLTLPKSPREQAKIVDISTYRKPVQKMEGGTA